MKQFDIGNYQIQGGRDYQDDSFTSLIIDDNTYLLLVADGMGGYAGGKIASEVVIKSFKVNFDTNNPNIKEALNNALIKANDDLAKEKESQPKFSQMGTTLIALYINQRYAQWLSVGDSPLWLLRKSESIKRINKNHSVAGLLELQYKYGEITKDEMLNSPNRHMLTSAITGEELKSIDLSNKLELKPNDTFILASDGVETLSIEEIERIFRSSQNNIEAVKKVTAKIIEKNIPNQDNTTIVAISPKGIKENRKVTRYNTNILNKKKDDKNHLIKNIIYILSLILVVMVSALIYLKFNSIYTSKKVTDTNISNNKIDSNIKDNNLPIIPIVSKEINCSKKESVEDKNKSENIEKDNKDIDSNSIEKNNLVSINKLKYILEAKIEMNRGEGVYLIIR